MKQMIEWKDCPQWAKDEAARRSQAKDWASLVPLYDGGIAVVAVKMLACMIATHEDEPVEPLKQAAIEWISERMGLPHDCIEDLEIETFIAGYNRGLADAKPKWIEHTGRECPVDDEVLTVRFYPSLGCTIGSSGNGEWTSVKKYIVLEKPE